MILNTKEKFEQAILAKKEIKTKTVFYTDKLEEQHSLKVGSLYEGGILAGYIDDKPVIVTLKDLSRQMTFDDAVKNCQKGFRVPTQQELMLIYINKDKVNKGLVNNGGEPLKEAWYWSSSEYSYGNAWDVGLSDGSVNAYGKGVYVYVRPVLDF